MSADYSRSTQRLKWKFTKEDLLRRRDDPQAYLRIRMFLGENIAALGVRLNMRQRVVSTAQVFLSRVLTKTAIGEINPYLLMATCVYVAGRTEEQPTHLRIVCSEACQQWPLFMPVEPWQLAECEFYVLAELETCLVVYHPYIPLMKLSAKFSLAVQETQACWAVINDACATDVPLIYSPVEIAFTAIYMVLVLKPGLISNRPPDHVKKRLDSLSRYMGFSTSLDLRALMGCIQELLSMYALKNEYKSAQVAEELKALI